MKKVAREDKDASVRRAAVEKITDQEVLVMIAVEAGDAYVRQAAFRKLHDKSLVRHLQDADDPPLSLALKNRPVQNDEKETPCK